MACAAVAQIIAVHAGDHDIAQPQGCDRACQVVRLIQIQWVGPPVAHIAKRAAAGALVAHDHEGGSPFAKALANIGAGRLFADGN